MIHHDGPGTRRHSDHHRNSQSGEPGLGGRRHSVGGSHHAHMVADFRRRFWVSLVLSIPVLALAPLIQAWLGLGDVLAFPGDRATQAVLATVVYFYEAGRFCAGSPASSRSASPG